MTDDGDEQARIDGLIDQLLATHDPERSAPRSFWAAQFDAGLAWVHAPVGLGGCDAPAALQRHVDERLAAAGAPSNALVNFVGLGIVAPALLGHGTPAQHARLRPLFSGEEIWCQLFSEPGAGSDLLALSTSARRDGDEWVLDGHKIWTTLGHIARWGILVARSDPDSRRRQGLTFFLLDMRTDGVDIRPLRQISGEAEFNEVLLVDVRVPDAMRLGPAGGGWGVLLSTLMNERSHNGELATRARGLGPIAQATRLWGQIDGRDPSRRDALARAWIDAEVLRLTALRARAGHRAGGAGPEGSILKLATGQLPQQVYELCANLRGAAGMLIADYEMTQPELMGVANMGDGLEEIDLTTALLNSRSATIGGGTTEIQRNTIGERVLGLPKDPPVEDRRQD